MRPVRLLAALSLLPALLRGQAAAPEDGGNPGVRPREFTNELAFSLEEESVAPPDDGARPVALSELVRLAPGEAAAACAAITITPDAPLARAGAARCEGGELFLKPGRWRLTAAEPPPAPLSAHYERLDVAFTVAFAADSPPWLAAEPAAIDDRSRLREPSRAFCIRLVEADGGPAIPGLRVRFHARYRAVAEGITDERGAFCAEGLGAWPLTVSVNGGEAFRDAAAGYPADAIRGEIALTREERVSCRIVDPGGFLRVHPAARFAIRPLAARTDTALSPGTPVAWNPWGDRRRDTVSFGVLTGDLPPDDGGPWPPAKAAPAASPADAPGASAQGDAESRQEFSPLDAPGGVQILLVEDEADAPLARFALSPRALRRACTLVLPEPARRTVRLSLECPAGGYLWPGLRAVLLAERAPAAPGEAARTLVAVSPETPPEISRARRFSVPLAGDGEYRLLPPQCPGREGCLREPVPIHPDENGAVTLALPAGQCVARELAIAVGDRLAEAARERSPEGPAETAEDRYGNREDCLAGLPVTALEREALRRERDGLACPALFELIRFDAGPQADEAGGGLVEE